MSFILDALRKSEIDRQRDAAPGLMRSPIANVRRETPVWSWLLIGLLALALVGIATAWWLRGPGETGTAVTAGEPEAMAPAPAATTAASTGSSASIGSGTSGASGASRASGAPSDAQAASPSAAAAPSTGEPRPIVDLIRSDPGLPRYTLSFVQFNSADPDASSAWINGTRYYRGQVIDGGPELAGVRVDGVVLAWRGQTYLLPVR